MNTYDDLRARFDKMLDNPSRKPVTLFYVHYDDRLTDDQIAAYLDGSDEGNAEFMDQMTDLETEWFYANLNLGYYDDALETIYPGFWDLKRELEDAGEYDLADELWESGVEALFHWNDSDVIGELARNTPPQLVQYGDLAPGTDWADLSTDLQTNLEQVFDNLGLELNETNREAIETLIDETIYVHDGLTLTILNHAKIEDLGGFRGAITIETTDPVLALLDAWNGCVALARVDGTITVTVDHITLDSNHPGYGSINSICGLCESSVAADFKVTSN